MQTKNIKNRTFVNRIFKKSADVKKNCLMLTRSLLDKCSPPPHLSLKMRTFLSVDPSTPVSSALYSIPHHHQKTTPQKFHLKENLKEHASLRITMHKYDEKK